VAAGRTGPAKCDGGAWHPRERAIGEPRKRSARNRSHATEPGSNVVSIFAERPRAP
jgi:hypothetical protein